MRALEFVTGHVIYNPAYTYKFQLKTTLDFIEAFLCRKSAASSFRRSCIIVLTTILAHSFSFSDIQILSVLISSGKALPLLELSWVMTPVRVCCLWPFVLISAQPM